MMRFSLLALLLVSASSAFAQTKPPETRPVPSYRFSPFTEWQIAEFTAYTKKCLRSVEKIRNRFRLIAKIGPDGMIIGDPEIETPIDSDEFREDVKTALAKLHQCQPFIVDPFGRIKQEITVPFDFRPGGIDKEVTEAIWEHFRKCVKPTGIMPTIAVGLKYKPDGTYAEPPRLLNSGNSVGDSRMAAQVIRQMTKCPPLKFPQDKYYQVQSFKWEFRFARAPKKT